jgi:hypothetical protein
MMRFGPTAEYRTGVRLVGREGWSLDYCRFQALDLPTVRLPSQPHQMGYLIGAEGGPLLDFDVSVFEVISCLAKCSGWLLFVGGDWVPAPADLGNIRDRMLSALGSFGIWVTKYPVAAYLPTSHSRF